MIIVTVVLFETMILSALMLYYKGGVKQTLRDQGAMFFSFYEQELTGKTYRNEAEQLLSSYNFLVSVQTQLIDDQGNILAESHPTNRKNLSGEADVSSGLKGEVGYWTGNPNGEKVMSVTYPFKNNGKVVGGIRLTTSLEPMNAVFKENAFILIAIGAIVIILAALISYFLAGSITRPISQMITAAEQMAAGEFSIRIPAERDDELGRLAGTLNYMAKQVQEHEKLKNEFIASVSHDLRTPLTSVKGWAITLHSMTKDDFFREGLEMIDKESDRLSRLLGDLIDLSSLSSGRMSFAFEMVDLKDLILRVTQQLQPRAENQRVHLDVMVDEAIPAFRGDKNRLIQVMMNLIDNALKFTAAGGTITVVTEKKDSESVLIQVIDTGSGIPEDQLKSIKDKFVKGKTKNSGTGLGLAICEEIIKGHEGIFHLNSTPGEGTTAEITLPLTNV